MQLEGLLLKAGGMKNRSVRDGTQLVYLVAAVSALGGMLFGYDIGVISGAILFIKTNFSLSPGLEESS
jgi:hypothetical protein